MAGLRCTTAVKEHRCTSCGRLIPVGHKYWKKFDEKKGVDVREHTNCLSYENAEVLPEGFNQNRSIRK
jgi:hypothetical protein